MVYDDGSEIINGWVEESGRMRDIQGGFRRGRRTKKTKDNLFIDNLNNRAMIV